MTNFRTADVGCYPEIFQIPLSLVNVMLDVTKTCFCTLEYRWQPEEEAEAEAEAVAWVLIFQLLWKSSLKLKTR